MLRFLEAHEPDLLACADALGVAAGAAGRGAAEAGGMSRPLLITDCDEVLLHMSRHFAEWVAEAHGLDFDLDAPGFRDALRDARRHGRWRRSGSGRCSTCSSTSEMHRQNVVPGAAEALARDRPSVADIVILTNIGDEYQASRVAQLEAFDIRHRVLCNRGGKGRPVLELIEEMRPSATVFVDDLAVHHESVAKHAPEVWRLHMIAEPRLAAVTPPAPARPCPDRRLGRGAALDPGAA